ncbi:response regulator transcription factor [Leucobacter sp. CSA1]|uniref:Response regulator transcription factor n=1 Tax=Leucobacter chromiisoli TaxID=2796471 RepID=A0A934Q891_9MICO|nr:response regulator transcription factor [Leucobacter chromiisoli]MBK0419636.1 response regulator transcription factor [Leucobacter chromiisoli]
MTSQPLRVRLLNDYEIVVEGLRSMLAPYAERVRVVALDIQQPSERQADVTLYDTFGQVQADQRKIDEIIADPAAGAVVVYSWNTQEELVGKALDKGCRGYLEKSLSAAELVDRLERIAAGQVIAPEVRDRGVEEPAGGAWPGQHHGLTARESEVIALITQGLTNPEIAARSYITGNSLKSYIRSAYRKMGVERRSQAVRWGIENGMLPPQEV